CSSDLDEQLVQLVGHLRVCTTEIGFQQRDEAQYTFDQFLLGGLGRWLGGVVGALVLCHGQILPVVGPGLGAGVLLFEVKGDHTGRYSTGRATIWCCASRARTKRWKLGRTSCPARKGRALPGRRA